MEYFPYQTSKDKNIENNFNDAQTVRPPSSTGIGCGCGSDNAGEGVDQDYKQAMYWYLKAAAQESVGAYVNIGYMYKHGQGVEKDYQAAFE